MKRLIMCAYAMVMYATVLYSMEQSALVVALPLPASTHYDTITSLVSGKKGRVYGLCEGKLIRGESWYKNAKILQLGAPITALAVDTAADDAVLCAVGGKVIKVICPYSCQPESCTDMYSIDDGKDAVITHLDARNHLVACYSTNNQLTLWNAKNIKKVIGQRQKIMQLLIGGKAIFCGMKDGTVLINKADESGEFSHFNIPSQWESLALGLRDFAHMAYDHSRNRLYIADTKKNIACYELEDGYKACRIALEKYGYAGTIETMFAKLGCLFVAGSSGNIMALRIVNNDSHICVDMKNSVAEPIFHMVPTDMDIGVICGKDRMCSRIKFWSFYEDESIWEWLSYKLGVSLHTTLTEWTQEMKIFEEMKQVGTEE